MNRAFISHSADNSSGVVGTIEKKLKGKTLQMEAFLSTQLTGGTNFVVEIIEHLAQTDVLFFVIDAESHHSKWMEWEHEFCKNHDIPIVYVKFPSARWDNPMLRYINQQSLRIDYDDYKDDILCDRIQRTVESLRAERGGLDQRIAPVRINPDTNALHGEPNKTVTVSGRIQDNNQDYGSVYLHVPASDPKVPPTSTKATTFQIDEDGHFRCGIMLPVGPASAFMYTYYAEIRVGAAACIVPIHVKTEGSAPPRAPLPLDDCRPPASDPNQALDEMGQYSEGTFASIRRDIDGQEFPRQETKEAISLLSQTDRIVLTGDKGSGKTVILCQLYREIAGKRPALLVRCDDLLQSKSVDDLDEMLGGGITVSTCLARMPDDTKAVLIFDSLDVVSRDAKAMSLFRKFLQKLWATGKVQTVCSVREYDYEYSPSINTVEWGQRVHIGDLQESALEDVIRQVGNPMVPDDLKKILHNPLRLKLFHMIASRNPKASFANIKTEAQLYGEHWKEYVDREERPDAVACALLNVARHMVTSRRVAVPKHDFANLHDIDNAYSSGILAISGENVSFFHHAYLDYVASKYVLQNHPGIVGFLESDQHNVFLLPTLAFTLSLLHDGSKSAYLKAVVSICSSALQYYWKTAAVNSLAALDGFTMEEIDPIGRMLSDDADLMRHFLQGTSMAANPFWLRMWSGTLMKEWFGQPHNAKALLEYTASLSGHAELHDSMARLARMIVDNDDVHQIARQRAAMSIAGLSFESKAALCVDLSRHPNAYVRSGVLHCLGSLLDTDVDSASTVFANVASYRESSHETTSSISHGSFSMTSNKMQDNSLAVWEACRMFPDLLAKKPVAMIRAAIKTFELANAPLLGGGGGIVEDRSGAWMGGQTSPAYVEMLRSLEGALPDLLDENAPEFVEILASSRLAMFHRFLLVALLKRPEKFKDKICEELLIPHILALPSIREPARKAMLAVSPLLSEQQIVALLGRIMELGEGGSRAPGRPGTGIAGALGPYYLSAFDHSSLSAEQIELADRWPPLARPGGLASIDPQAAPSTAPATATDTAKDPLTLERAVEMLLGGERAERDAALDVIENAVKRAGDDSVELDATQAAEMSSLFLRLAGSPDPREDEPDGDRAAPVVVYRSARRLAAQGLIRLCARTGDRSLLSAIELLSRDRVNAVRGGVAEDIVHLYAADAALARAIAARYSRDADRQVLAYMPRAVFLLARSHPDDAVSAIRNILSTSGAADDMPETISHALLYLALAKGARPAGDLLQKVLDDENLPTEIRRCIPFTLKEGYLFPPGTQDGALEIFSRLLDSGEPTVRESAAFFLLASAGDDGPDSAAALIRKMGPHLDKIAAEAGADPPNQKTIEALVEFIEDHWHRMPARALAILESISRMPSAPYQPVYAGKTIAALNGLFRTLPGEDDQNRCLSVLDVYVRAGWPDAMDLLAKMGRPD